MQASSPRSVPVGHYQFVIPDRYTNLDDHEYNVSESCTDTRTDSGSDMPGGNRIDLDCGGDSSYENKYSLCD